MLRNTQDKIVRIGSSSSQLRLHRLRLAFCTSCHSLLKRHCLGLPFRDLKTASVPTQRSKAACASDVKGNHRLWPKSLSLASCRSTDGGCVLVSFYIQGLIVYVIQPSVASHDP